MTAPVDHVLYLVGIDFERDAWQGHAVRGVRAAWDAIESGAGGVGAYKAARSLVDTFADNPAYALDIGTSAEQDALYAAAEQALDASDGVLTFAIDLESRELEVPEAPVEPEPEEDDHDLLSGVFSPAAYKTALVFLAIADGNPTTAYHRTYILERASEDPALWEEVRGVLEAVFLPHPPDEGEEGGPQVVVLR